MVPQEVLIIKIVVTTVTVTITQVNITNAPIDKGTMQVNQEVIKAPEGTIIIKIMRQEMEVSLDLIIIKLVTTVQGIPIDSMHSELLGITNKSDRPLEMKPGAREGLLMEANKTHLISLGSLNMKGEGKNSFVYARYKILTFLIYLDQDRT